MVGGSQKSREQEKYHRVLHGDFPPPPSLLLLVLILATGVLRYQRRLSLFNIYKETTSPSGNPSPLIASRQSSPPPPFPPSTPNTRKLTGGTGTQSPSANSTVSPDTESLQKLPPLRTCRRRAPETLETGERKYGRFLVTRLPAASGGS